MRTPEFDERNQQPVYTEKLAYWFFRLNGCLTIENFVVHPDVGSDQRTDADIIGVRFPYRAELFANPMTDHPVFRQIGDRPFLFIAEVKGRTCRLNGPWTSPDRQNIQRVLRAVGAIPLPEVNAAADALYQTNKYDSDHYAVRLFGLGDRIGDFSINYPNAIPLTWDEVLRFIFRRFQQYHEQKRAHPQWCSTGTLLWKLAEQTRDEETFVSVVRQLLTNDQSRRVVSVGTD